MAVLKDLIVHGASRFLNTSYFNALKTNTIGADKGIFNKLIATDATIDNLDVEDLTAQNATVVGLLDVKGELHSNSWTNANIATIDGSFYITPTVSCASGTFAYNGTQITVTADTSSGQSFGIDNLYTSTTDGTTTTYTTWPQYSKVLLTGEVQLTSNSEWMPLGTIKGQISSATTTSIVINSLSDNRGTTPIATLVALGSTSISNANFRNVKISLYERASNSTSFYPMGIYMTALGAKGKTFIDIYGGGNIKGSVITGGVDSGAMTSPVLRIGNLSGLPTLGAVTPSGWGIYTTNGFFTGTIVAKQGKIGSGNAAWTIGNDSNSGKAMIYTGTRGSADSAYISTGIGTESIAGSGTLNTTNDGYWAFTAGASFGVTTKGKLYANNAAITGTITAKNFSALDNSGNIVAQLSDTLTIGQTTNNKFNIKITDTINTEDTSNRGPGVLLRKGTTVLNEINENGMKIYSAYTNSDTGLVQGDVIASFGVSATNHITECQIGSLQSRHFYINPNEFGFYSNNASYGKIDFVLKQKDNVKEDGHYTWDNFSGSNYQYTIPISTYQDLSNLIQISGKIIYDVGDGSSTYTFSCSPNGQFVPFVDNEAFTVFVGIFGRNASTGSPVPESDDVGVSISPNSGYQFTALEVNFTVTYSTYWEGPHYNFGRNVNSIGQYSFAMGNNTIAREDCQLVAGKFNSPVDDALFVIGNGTDSNNRSNLMVVGDNDVRIGDINASHLKLNNNTFQLIRREGYSPTVSFIGENWDIHNPTASKIWTKSFQRYPRVYSSSFSCLFDCAIAPKTKIHLEWDGYTVLFTEGIAEEQTFDDGNVTFNYDGSNFIKAYSTTPLELTGEAWCSVDSTENKFVFSGKLEEATGDNVFIFGRNTVSGGNSGAFGHGCVVTGANAFAFNAGKASSPLSFSINRGNADGYCSFCANESKAIYKYQTTIGKYNLVQNTAFEIGNGTSDSSRSNALTVDWDGVLSCRRPKSTDANCPAATNNEFASVFDLIYPVGAIYMSTNSTSPEYLFGGTWVQIEDRFLLAAGSAYTAGAMDGAATVTLTDAQMAHGHGFTQPTVNGGSCSITSSGGHSHTVRVKYTSGKLAVGTGTYQVRSDGSSTSDAVASTVTNGAHTHSVPSHTHSVSGGAVSNLSGASSTRTAHNNMPPYLVVYVWERTA